MQQLKPGSKLNNKYRILRFIGQGGFAFAYEAVQEPIGLKVCIKELFIKESRDTFLREGRILATLKSDSIVKVLDYFEENETSYKLAIDLPGFKKDEISLDLRDGYLTISAEKGLDKDEQEKESGHYIRRERYAGACSRSFYVGEDVQQEDIKAEFKHGILKLFVPKKEAKPAVEEKKHIAIEG